MGGSVSQALGSLFEYRIHNARQGKDLTP